MAWSGLRSYDLDRPRLRMGMYCTVLAEGQHEDLVRRLNRDLLIDQWHRPARAGPPAPREVWERSFPGLAAAGSAAV